jgi:hypothetical protein
MPQECERLSKLTTRRPSEILAMAFDDSDCILGDRLLAKGQSLTILGAGGLGKSRLSLQLATATRTGKRFVGLETYGEHLRWLFIQGENSTRRLQKDLEAMYRWSGSQWPEVDAGIVIHTLENDEDSFLNLDDPANRARVGEIITEHNADVVVFDPLNSFGVGDLSKDSDMRNTCQILSGLTKRGQSGTRYGAAASRYHRQVGCGKGDRLRARRVWPKQQSPARLDAWTNQCCSRITRRQFHPSFLLWKMQQW